jgi:hypothetical protein
MDPVSIALALAQFAPSILRFFGAGEKPAAVAEKVVQIAQAVTGKGTPEEALTAMRESAKLAQDFNLAVLAADTKLEELCLADRASARARDVEVRKLAGGKNQRADVMVVCDFLGLVVCLIVLALYRKDLPGEAVALISTVASIFGLCLRDAHQFEFGSSRGSRDKDEMLAKKAG